MSKAKGIFGRLAAAAVVVSAFFWPVGAQALDKVKVGVFPVSSSLPYFVARDRGFFKDAGIDVEMVRLIGGPPNVAGLITNQIDASAVLVTIEGMNADLKKPGVAMYISINAQNAQYQMEQFVVRKGVKANSLADLKGMKIMSAPGPANVTMAKAVLAAVGLKEGDYTLDQLDMGQHINAMTAGTFDAGYTLEPNASVMRANGVATTLEAGVIAKYILGDPKALAWIAGGVISSDFIKNRTDVAKRYTAAWLKAIDFINTSPQEARKYLAKNTFTPDSVVATVPLVKFTKITDLTAGNKAEFQKFIDFSTASGILSQKVDVTKYLYHF
ncbi:MAG: ABC transporter substrate-binding protein [Betaproteobacteria bacterium]|jgi:NitT/TauT family transport system substrate-binding protein|nr:ABC transporter substrate-binding protein [Betaproteobacteria bacterium]